MLIKIRKKPLKYFRFEQIRDDDRRADLDKFVRFVDKSQILIIKQILGFAVNHFLGTLDV